MKDLEARVTDLEIHITHQAKMLDDLNETIAQQQNTIEGIKRVNKLLFNGFEQLGIELSLEQLRSSNQTPPHY